jgi:hypothetical protein
MRNKFLFGLLISAILFGNWDSVFAESLSPAWQIGDTWTLKVRYSKLDTSGEADGDWSPPVHWEYRVSDTVVREGFSYWRVRVQEKGNTLGFSADLFFRTTDRSLWRAQLTSTRGGEPFRRDLFFNRNVPVATEQAPIPFDTPVFPLNVGQDTIHSLRRSIGEDMIQVQTVRQVVTDVANDSVPQDIASIGEAQVRVQCTDEDGNIIFLQYWKPGAHWASYGENSDMRYWLVDTQ